ncbi:MAG TPA: Uma2 family endonuclease [Longimicrobium sp.]
MSTTTDEPTTPEPKPYRLSPQAYLVRERAAEYKREYNDGEIEAMGGASRPHSLICTALMRLLGNQLAGRGCELHAHDMRVQLDAGRRYVYPDVVVVCGRAIYQDAEVDVLVNPTAVVEVLSRTTEKKDRGWKFAAYRRVESLQEIVFVSQSSPVVEVHRRGPDGEWHSLLPLQGTEAVLRLDSIGCAVPLADIYAGVLQEPKPAGTRARPSPRTRAVPGSRDREHG